MLKVFALLALLVGICSASPVDRNSREFTTYRLPNTTIPTHYDLYLDTNVHLADLAYSGNVKINIRVLESTSQIVLHSTRSVIGRLELRNSNQLAVPVKGHEVDEDKQFLIVNTNVELPAGSTYVLDIDFTNSLNRTDASGFYRSSYVNAAGETKYLGVTQFEPCDARSAFPCFDEPGIKATLNVQIACGVEYSAKANAPALGITLLPGGKKLTTFQTTPRIQTYLIAFLVSDFITERQVVSEPRQLVVSTLARPTASQLLTYSVSASVQFLRELEIYFDQSYAMSKIDNVAVANIDFAAGAMENWGLVTYRESTILFDPETQGESQQLSVVGIVGHEYTHQFFGNLLAPEWWSYLWLNEGFARLYQYYVSEFSHPELKMRDRFAGVLQAALTTDASPTVRPMTYYVETPSEIGRLFDNIAYAKAASVLRMLNYAVTEHTFQKGLRYYIQQNKDHGVVNEENLFDSLEQAVREDAQLPQSLTMHEIFRSWSRQPGAPVVTVTRVGDTNEYLFNQERFYSTPQEAPEQQSWWIPISYFTPSSNGQFNSSAALWMPPYVTDVSMHINLVENDFVLVNPLARGYYRVNYDPLTWENIIYNLYENTNAFHRLSRSQLIDDSMNLAHAGKLDYYTAFKVFDYLLDESDFLPWSTASSNLRFLQRMLRHDSVASENLKSYSSMLASNLLATYGFDPIKGESADDEDARLIALEWACGNDKPCQTEATQRLSKLRTKAASFAIVSKSEQLIICSQLRKATYDDFSAILSNLKNTPNSRSRSYLIEAASCIENRNAINAFVDSLKSNDFGAAEKTQILQAIYSNSLGGLDAIIDMFDSSENIAFEMNIDRRQLYTLLEDIAEYTVEPQAAARLINIVKREAPTQLVTTIQAKLHANQSWIQRNAAIVSTMLKNSPQIDM
ncbi:aminopeptidase N-like [Ochlerotatus camptorhynchus]|uniref:aminopeptidase N-like n=1 Tax=Ochlerotatus camptorhynchus TaxID=644619 RepID=UPI0031DCCB19